MRVVFENVSPFPRTDWISFSAQESLLPESGPLVLGEFDAFLGRRIGGGLRLVHSRVSMAGLSRESRILQVGGAGRVPDQNPAGGAFAPEVHLLINGQVWSPQTSLRSDGICTILHMQGRVPGTRCVGEFWAYIYPGAHSVPWELLLVSSDPTRPHVYEQLDSVALSISGPVIVQPYWPRWNGVAQLDANTVELTRATTIADSQGLAWAGVVALTDSPSAGASLHGPICAIAQHPEWGPFRREPDAVAGVERTYTDRLLAWLWATQTTGDVWRRPRLGLAPNSGQTGAQDDFGATKLGWAFAGGPGHIFEAYHSALSEACRPGHFREADGTPVEPWYHPNHVTWGGYTHFSSSVSSDRLGMGIQPTPRFVGGFTGPDREHWSNNLLCGVYALTGSLMLQRIIEKQARQFLSGETIDPRLSTSNAGAARGVGRTMHAASWITRCLEPGSMLLSHVKERIRQRLVIIERQTRPVSQPSLTEVGGLVYDLNSEPLRALELVGASPSTETYRGAVGYLDDPRAMGSGVVCVATWQEALAIVGLRAAALDGYIDAQTVLLRAAEAWIRHGWYEQDGRWWLADYVARDDVTHKVRREGFEEWATGALRICANVLPGDLAQRAGFILASFPSTTVAESEWRATL